MTAVVLPVHSDESKACCQVVRKACSIAVTSAPLELTCSWVLLITLQANTFVL